MKTTYIQFDAPKSDSQTAKDGLIRSSLKKAFVGILKTIIPKANPDFDDKIDEVQYWLVECDNETGIPEREIGLDKEGRVILKMPFKDNYGYWTDNNLLLNDFKEHFLFPKLARTVLNKVGNCSTKYRTLKLKFRTFKLYQLVQTVDAYI